MRALLLLMLAYCPVFVLAQEGRPADTVKVKGQTADSVWMVGQTDTVRFPRI